MDQSHMRPTYRTGPNSVVRGQAPEAGGRTRSGSLKPAPHRNLDPRCYRRAMAVPESSAATSLIDRALWILTILCIVATVWFSFGAPPPGVTLFPYADKIEHAIAYFATTLSFLFAAVWRPGRGPGRWPWMGLWFPVAAIAAGALIEFLQGMTPTREAQALDLIAEVIGTMAAVAIHSTIRRISRPGPRIEM